jgi:hypothetical protein
MNKALFWFRLLVTAGGIANLTFALPAFFAPPVLLELIDVGQLDQSVWLRNVGILLIIITTFYIPAILDPFRYAFNSVVLVVGRFSAGVFFLVLVLFADYPDGFRVLAGGDLVFSTLQAIALFFVFRGGDPRLDQGG